MLIGEILEKSAWSYPKKEAVVGKEMRLTYEQLNERVNRLANSLLELGLKEGERIAILSKNSVHYMELYFAIGKAGGISVPMNWRFRKDELSYILTDSVPKAIFFSSEYLSLIDSLREELKTIVHYILIDGKANWTISFDDLIQNGEPHSPEVDIALDDIAFQFYTSGTTARPKGTLWSHRTAHYNCLNACLEWSYTRDTILLAVLPLFHNMGPLAIAGAYIGGTSVILREFEVEKTLETIEKERVTFLIMVPTMIIMMIEHPDIRKYDTSSLRLILYGGAPMPVKPLQKAMEILKCGFHQSFGMTELNAICGLKPEDHIMDGSEAKFKRLHSVGTLAVDVVGIKIVDDNGNELSAGKTGEIATKSPSHMLGYWNLPDETAKALRGGWLYTGDIGYVDEDRYLYITERKKDIIISGGENISSKEVEDVIYSHPAVLEVTVIGVPDDLWGEAVKAVIALKNGKKATEEEIIQFCKHKLAGFKRPKSVDFVESLPKSTVGKILKKEVRKWYLPDLA
jgi:long-chain acyl-CoA synthetase